MGEINAEIGLQQLKKIKQFKIKRQRLVDYYILRLKKYDKFFSIYNFKSKKIFWHLFVILLKGNLKK